MRRLILVAVPMVVAALLVASCGRQLPETNVTTSTNDSSSDSIEVTASSTAATDETEADDTVDEEITPEVDETTNGEENVEEAIEPTEADVEEETAEVTLTGDPVAGEALFNEFINEVAFACSTCHHVDSEERLIGPGLEGISTRAANRVEGQQAIEYLRVSITHPSDYIVTDYPDQLMPQTYSDVFTEEQIDDLVAYMMSL
jgi:cytochrome c2